MHFLVTYDVSTSSEGGQRRLRRAAKICLDYGQRVQNSVFECQVNPVQAIELKKRLMDVIDKEYDSLRFYNLGAHWDQRVEHIGIKPSMNPNSPMII